MNDRRTSVRLRTRTLPDETLNSMSDIKHTGDAPMANPSESRQRAFLLPESRTLIELDTYRVLETPQGVELSPGRQYWSPTGLVLMALPAAAWTALALAAPLFPHQKNAQTFVYSWAPPFLVVLWLCMTGAWVIHVARLKRRGPLVIAHQREGTVELPRSRTTVNRQQLRAVRLSRARILPSPGTHHEFGTQLVTQLILDVTSQGMEQALLVSTHVQSDRRLREAARRFAELIDKPYVERELARIDCPTATEISNSFKLVI